MDRGRVGEDRGSKETDGCPLTALMWLESDQYYQGKRNVEAYIDECKNLVDLSGYTDHITIVLKFC
jgi:hypothetical protein